MIETIEINVIPAFVNRGSFIELNGRERTQALFDKVRGENWSGPSIRSNLLNFPCRG